MAILSSININIPFLEISPSAFSVVGSGIIEYMNSR